MGWGQLLVLDILVLMSSISSEEARLKFVVAPEQSTPIGSDVQVDQGLVDNFTIVVGSGLKGDEGVDVYRSHGDTPTGGVGVNRRAGAQEILGLTGILIGILIGQSKRDADAGLKFGADASVVEVNAKELGDVSNEPLEYDSVSQKFSLIVSS